MSHNNAQQNNKWKMVVSDSSIELTNYLKHIQILVEEKYEEAKLHEQRIKSMRENNEIDPTDDDGDDGVGDMYYYADTNANMLYRPFVMAIVMTVETKLRDLARHWEKQEKFKLKTFNGKGIKKYIEYVKISTGKDIFTGDTKLHVDILIIVRNSIAHVDSYVIDERNRKKIDDYAKKYPNMLKINEDGEIYLEHSYCQFLIELESKICDDITNLSIHDVFPSN